MRAAIALTASLLACAGSARATCTLKPVGRQEAIRLARLTPDVLETKAHGAILGSDGGDIAGPDGLAPGKRVVRVYFTNDITPGGSNLIGWYAIDPRTAMVTNAIPDLSQKPLSTPELAAEQARLRKRDCR